MTVCRGCGSHAALALFQPVQKSENEASILLIPTPSSSLSLFREAILLELIILIDALVRLADGDVHRSLFTCLCPCFCRPKWGTRCCPKKKVGVVRAKKASPAYLYTQGAALHSASLRAPCFDFIVFMIELKK
jgi:hypothetical protein